MEFRHVLETGLSWVFLILDNLTGASRPFSRTYDCDSCRRDLKARHSSRSPPNGWTSRSPDRKLEPHWCCSSSLWSHRCSHPCRTASRSSFQSPPSQWLLAETTARASLQKLKMTKILESLRLVDKYPKLSTIVSLLPPTKCNREIDV